jgi:hypothetical protein
MHVSLADELFTGTTPVFGVVFFLGRRSLEWRKEPLFEA